MTSGSPGSFSSTITIRHGTGVSSFFATAFRLQLIANPGTDKIKAAFAPTSRNSLLRIRILLPGVRQLVAAFRCSLLSLEVENPKLAHSKKVTSFQTDCWSTDSQAQFSKARAYCHSAATHLHVLHRQVEEQG